METSDVQQSEFSVTRREVSQSPYFVFQPEPGTEFQPVASVHLVSPPSCSRIHPLYSTPKSNFTISPPRISSSSSNSSSNDDGNIDMESDFDDSEVSGIPHSLPRYSARNCEQESVIGPNGSIHSNVLKRRRLLLEERSEGDDLQDSNDTVLSVAWGGGKLGAAYYEVATSQLHILPDISEHAPDYLVLHSLYSQVMPKYIIASQRQDTQMILVLKELCGEVLLGEESSQNINEFNTNARAATQLIILPGKEFAPDPCKRRLQSLKLPYEPSINDADDHILFITSLIPFRNEVMVRAAGALLKYLDVSGIALLQIELVEGQTPVLDVSLISMNDLVMVDCGTWRSLQIFNVDLHPAGNKMGTSSDSKEGLSLYSWLNHCCTAQGAKYLRRMLLHPTRDAITLNRRFDVVEYCSNATNMEFIKAAMDCLKRMKSIPKLLFNLSVLHGSPRDWKDLYQTIYHALLLGEICSAESTNNIAIFKEICETARSRLFKEMSQEIMRVVNFEESIEQRRVIVKVGIDPELDKKKQQFALLPDVMSMVAAEEMKALPGCVTQCAVVYLPEVGYLLCVTLSEGERNAMDPVQIEGLEFKFMNQEMSYYKSPRMRELDIVLGDCQVAILDKETCIMIHLSQYILKNSATLIKIGDMASHLDALIAIAKVAEDNHYVRPVIVEGHESLLIQDGRHPLMEQLCDDFVPNSTICNDENKVIILTGPNASGKSIYMKQIGMIVLMALSGSFVPAYCAQIPTFDRICTRMQTAESTTSGLSSFMTDINQMSLALRTATKSSLVLIDEFGKGTSEADGLSLLAASVRDLLRRNEDCPTVFLTTHYLSLMNYVDPALPFKLQTMEFIKTGNDIVYLFKLIEGSSASSFASLLAENEGVPDHIISRSSEIERRFRGGRDSENIFPVDNGRQHKEGKMISIADEFLAIDLDCVRPREYLQLIYKTFETVDRAQAMEDDEESPL